MTGEDIPYISRGAYGQQFGVFADIICRARRARSLAVYRQTAVEEARDDLRTSDICRQAAVDILDVIGWELLDVPRTKSLWPGNAASLELMITRTQ